MKSFLAGVGGILILAYSMHKLGMVSKDIQFVLVGIILISAGVSGLVAQQLSPNPTLESVLKNSFKTNN